jgi:hypothetical protein
MLLGVGLAALVAAVDGTSFDAMAFLLDERA